MDRSRRFRALTLDKTKHVAVKADTHEMPRILPIMESEFHEALAELRERERTTPDVSQAVDT